MAPPLDCDALPRGKNLQSSPTRGLRLVPPLGGYALDPRGDGAPTSYRDSASTTGPSRWLTPPQNGSGTAPFDTHGNPTNRTR